MVWVHAASTFFCFYEKLMIKQKKSLCKKLLLSNFFTCRGSFGSLFLQTGLLYILIQCTYPCRLVNFRLHYLTGSFSFISGSVVSMNNFELSLFVFFSPLLSVKQLPQVQVVLLVALKMRRQNLKFCLIQLMQMQFRRWILLMRMSKKLMVLMYQRMEVRHGKELSRGLFV